MNDSLNKFGGEWTETKIEVFVKYLQAYLVIMSKQVFPDQKPMFKLVYFDGFAGCGEIEANSEHSSLIEGVASRVLKLDQPRSFDMYYMVELDPEKAKKLKKSLKHQFPEKSRNIHVAQEDCNIKLLSLSNFLGDEKRKFHRVLAFIDPFAMQVKWSSIESLRGKFVDLWILVPTGAINRMLANHSEIPESWKTKLESCLGLNWAELYRRFYAEKTTETLFGPETTISKEKRIFDAIITCYREQLETVWKYVSTPLALKNSKGTIIFHFIFASQKQVAMKIANQIIQDY